MRVIGILAKWVLILCIPFLLLSAGIACTLNSAWLYKYGFDKYDVSATTGLADTELDKVATELIGYFNSSEEYIEITVIKDGKPFILFNQREITHLKDVKGLIWLDYRILLGTLIYALVYAGICLFWHKRKSWRNLAWGVVGGSSLTLVLMLALGLGMLFDFDQLFLQFHFLSFANDLWQLDPANDYLIMLVTQGFQYDVALLWVVGTAGAAFVMGGVSGGFLFFSRKSLHFQQQMS